MKNIEIVPALSEHIDELGTAYYAAFKDFTDRHNAPMGSPDSAAYARKMYSILIKEDSAIVRELVLLRIGLGSRDYNLVDVDPADPEKYKFPYDRRPSSLISIAYDKSYPDSEGS